MLGMSATLRRQSILSHVSYEYFAASRLFRDSTRY
jgi:hypothetical protein